MTTSAYYLNLNIAYLDSNFFIVFFITILITLVISVAFVTLIERKTMASIQRRKGPNVVGIVGLLQPIVDGVKLFCKEEVLPNKSDTPTFDLAPKLIFAFSLVIWVIIPFNYGYTGANLNLGFLIIFILSGLSIYGIILAGWSSNSKYPFLGAIRSAAQMIAYEISIGFLVLILIFCIGSFNIYKITFFQEHFWLVGPLFPLFVVLFISFLAETNRHPFDLPEAEAELVSGYNVEYSGIMFALFFLAEYVNIILVCLILTICFLGNWYPPCCCQDGFFFFNTFLQNDFFEMFGGAILNWIKTFVLVAMFVILRAALPRYRYDQLMQLGWKVFLPFSLGYFLFLCGNLISVDGTCGVL